MDRHRTVWMSAVEAQVVGPLVVSVYWRVGIFSPTGSTIWFHIPHPYLAFSLIWWPKKDAVSDQKEAQLHNLSVRRFLRVDHTVASFVCRADPAVRGHESFLHHLSFLCSPAVTLHSPHNTKLQNSKTARVTPKRTAQRTKQNLKCVWGNVWTHNSYTTWPL